MSLSPDRPFERLPSVFRCLAKVQQTASTCSPHPIGDLQTLPSLPVSPLLPQPAYSTAPQSCLHCYPLNLLPTSVQPSFTFVQAMEHRDLLTQSGMLQGGRQPEQPCTSRDTQLQPFPNWFQSVSSRKHCAGAGEHVKPGPPPPSTHHHKQGHQEGTKSWQPPRHGYILQW